MYKGENKSKEEFNQELTSTLQRMDERIETLSEMLNFHNGQNVDDKFSNLNKLKFHRYKVKEALEKTRSMETENWRKIKSDFTEIFEKAEGLLENEQNK